MKKILYIFLFYNVLITNAQTITNLTLTQGVGNSIDVYLEVTHGHLINLITNNFSIDGNIITFDSCYTIFGQTVVTYENSTTNIVLPNGIENYTINVLINTSGSLEECDYTGQSDTATLSFSLPLTEPVVLANTYLELDNNISIYPNPIKDGFVKLNNIKNIDIQDISLYSLLGKKLTQYKTNFNTLDLRSYNAGIYYIKIKTNKGTFNKKILIEN
jgi:hypothetical protein